MSEYTGAGIFWIIVEAHGVNVGQNLGRNGVMFMLDYDQYLKEFSDTMALNKSPRTAKLYSTPFARFTWYCPGLNV